MRRIVNVKSISIMFAILWTFFLIQFITIIVRSQKSVYEYANFLTNKFLGSCGMMFLLFTIFMVIGIVLIVLFVKFGSDIIEIWMIVVWTIFIIAGFAWIQYQFQAFDKDIQNEDCIVYIGDFEKDSSRGFVFLEDATRTRVYNTNETFLKPGHYSGRIIYSKRTKYVLAYILDSGENFCVP